MLLTVIILRFLTMMSCVKETLAQRLLLLQTTIQMKFGKKELAYSIILTLKGILQFFYGNYQEWLNKTN
ncbi:hypothetical protein SAMN04488130_105118 [Flavobacterium urumqiense]|uniref:Uncharacterized protein n=1 Tax=Flavobacterium urumqiense TaxID=935224 RepID=A0A1H5WYX4_9FLAO|nr:hypothetical protein SAMN04488130_105118 [Flavobacterium urumqiense]